jgi:hypothetical protein
MKKIISLIFTTLVLMVSSDALSDEKKDSNVELSKVVKDVVPEMPSSEKDLTAISPMRKSQFAPFTGVLLSPMAIATIISEIKFQQEKIDIEVRKAVETANVEFTYKQQIFENRCEADKKVMQANVEEKKKQIALLDSTIKAEIESRPNPVIWSLFGLAAGVVVTTTTASIITAVAN